MTNRFEELQSVMDDATDAVPAREPHAPSASTAGADMSLKSLEQRHIEQVLADSPTFTEAATRLGIDTATLWRKRKRYRIR